MAAATALRLETVRGTDTRPAPMELVASWEKQMLGNRSTNAAVMSAVKGEAHGP